MKKRENDFIVWVKEHKIQLLLAGISITAVIGTVIGLKNKDAIQELWSSLQDSIKVKPEMPLRFSTITPISLCESQDMHSSQRNLTAEQIINVKSHIRELSGGRRHSHVKELEAAELGITLLPNQTIVDAYTKCAA